MKEMSLRVIGFERKTKRARKREFFDEMDLAVPLPEPARDSQGGRLQFPLQTMLRMHFLRHCGNLFDPAIEEALHDTLIFRKFAGLDAGEKILPDESAILRFRHLLVANNLSTQILVTINVTLTAKGLLLSSGNVFDATLIAAPSSTKNSGGESYPEMRQTKKGNQWHFGMNAHIGVDADSGLVHSLLGKSAYVNGVTQASAILHGDGTDVFSDAGYQGVDKREETQGIDGDWHLAMRPGKRWELDKNTAQLHSLFALSNFWMVCRMLLLGCGHECVCKRRIVRERG